MTLALYIFSVTNLCVIAGACPATTIMPPAQASRVSIGSITLPDGSRFKTTLYHLKVIGQLEAAHKKTFYIMSGTGCHECDANTAIYIHSPSDGPMKGEGGQRRFNYPGTEVDYQTSKPVYQSRMFYGSCAQGHPNAAIWFERFLGEDGKWHSDVFVAEVKGDNLVAAQLSPRNRTPKLATAEEAVQMGLCHELQGIRRSSEP